MEGLRIEDFRIEDFRIEDFRIEELRIKDFLKEHKKMVTDWNKTL